MFICNHCPYVMSVIDRLCRDMRDVQALGFGIAAIMSNDTVAYPDDAPDKMKALAQEHGFTFPICSTRRRPSRAPTPPHALRLLRPKPRPRTQYRGRLDSSGRAPATPETRRELVDAMRQIAATGKGPENQMASIGCSLKWKAR